MEVALGRYFVGPHQRTQLALLLRRTALAKLVDVRLELILLERLGIVVEDHAEVDGVRVRQLDVAHGLGGLLLYRLLLVRIHYAPTDFIDLIFVARGCVGGWLEDIKIFGMMRVDPANVGAMPSYSRPLLVSWVKGVALVVLAVEVVDVHWYAPSRLLHVLQSTHAHTMFK